MDEFSTYCQSMLLTLLEKRMFVSVLPRISSPCMVTVIGIPSNYTEWWRLKTALYPATCSAHTGNKYHGEIDHERKGLKNYWQSNWHYFAYPVKPKLFACSSKLTQFNFSGLSLNIITLNKIICLSRQRCKSPVNINPFRYKPALPLIDSSSDKKYDSYFWLRSEKEPMTHLTLVLPRLTDMGRERIVVTVISVSFTGCIPHVKSLGSLFLTHFDWFQYLPAGGALVLK